MQWRFPNRGQFHDQSIYITFYYLADFEACILSLVEGEIDKDCDVPSAQYFFEVLVVSSMQHIY